MLAAALRRGENGDRRGAVAGLMEMLQRRQDLPWDLQPSPYMHLARLQADDAFFQASQALIAFAEETLIILRQLNEPPASVEHFIAKIKADPLLKPLRQRGLVRRLQIILRGSAANEASPQTTAWHFYRLRTELGRCVPLLETAGDYLVLERADAAAAPALATIVRRARAAWPYHTAALVGCRGHKCLASAALSAHPTFILRDGQANDEPVGFYVLHLRGGPHAEARFAHMCLAPHLDGVTFARILWRHACKQARAAGARAIWVDCAADVAPLFHRLGADERTTLPDGGWRCFSLDLDEAVASEASAGAAR